MKESLILGAAVLSFLLICSGLAVLFNKKSGSETSRKMAEIWSTRTRMWWGMAAIFVVALLTKSVGSIIVFSLISFMLLRELITVTPTRNEDHKVLLSAFFMILPIHYLLLISNWYGLFVILIPVYAFFVVPTMIAATGSLDRFFERAAKIQWALMLCVYCVSHAPALLLLRMDGAPFPNAPLLMFLIIVVQAKETVASLVNTLPNMHPTLKTENVQWTMTWEGVLTGTAAACAIGLALSPLTEFSLPQALAMSITISFMCGASNMCLAGLKSDWGRHGTVLIECHGAMIDRIMPLCFAAPVFFHLSRFYCLTATPVGFH